MSSIYLYSESKPDGVKVDGVNTDPEVIQNEGAGGTNLTLKAGKGYYCLFPKAVDEKAPFNGTTNGTTIEPVNPELNKQHIPMGYYLGFVDKDPQRLLLFSELHSNRNYYGLVVTKTVAVGTPGSTTNPDKFENDHYAIKSITPGGELKTDDIANLVKIDVINNNLRRGTNFLSIVGDYGTLPPMKFEDFTAIDIKTSIVPSINYFSLDTKYSEIAAVENLLATIGISPAALPDKYLTEDEYIKAAKPYTNLLSEVISIVHSKVANTILTNDPLLITGGGVGPISGGKTSHKRVSKNNRPKRRANRRTRNRVM